MQVSRYNIPLDIIDEEGGSFYFNTYSSSFIRIPNTISLNDDIASSGLSDACKSKLLASGFWDDGSQTSKITAQYRRAIGQYETFSLVLCPTIACNFSCSYCFQINERPSGVMSNDVVERTIAFVQALHSRNTFPNLALTWYGGEPLIAYRQVAEYTNRIRVACHDANINLVNVDVITNGTLLSDKVVETLVDANIVDLQVSLDALYYKDRLDRGVINADGTLSPIVENIKKYEDRLNFVVRINVNTGNAIDIEHILQVLRSNIQSTVSLSRVESSAEDKIHWTRENGSRCGSGAVKTETLSFYDFAQLEKSHYRATQSGLEMLVSRLRRKEHYCSATNHSMAVIDPDGSISRCWISAGKSKQSVANVKDGNALDRWFGGPNSRVWNTYGPDQYQECMECRVLPVCMGGCSHGRNFAGATAPQCDSIRHLIAFAANEVGRRLTIPND